MQQGLCTPLSVLALALVSDASEATTSGIIAKGLARSAHEQADVAATGRANANHRLEGLIAEHGQKGDAWAGALGTNLLALQTALEEHEGSLEKAFASGILGIQEAQKTLQEAAVRGSSATKESLQAADAMLRSSWTEASVQLGGLREGMAEALQALRAEGHRAVIAAETAEAAAAVLRAASDSEAAALSAVCAEVAADVARLRQQRDMEQEVVTQLQRQREALTEDVACVEASLQSSRASVEAAKQAMKAAEASQAQRRQQLLSQVVGGLEALLSAELQGMGSGLRTDAEAAVNFLAQASGHSAAASAGIRQAEERACEAQEQLSATAHDWAAVTEEACDGIDAAGGEVLRSAQAAADAAGRASNDLCEAASSARGSATQSEHLAESLGAAAQAAENLLGLQASLLPRWEAQAACSTTAISAWASGSETGLLHVGQGLQQLGEAKGLAATLCGELRGQWAAASDCLGAWAAGSKLHGEALAGLLSLQQTHHEESSMNESSIVKVAAEAATTAEKLGPLARRREAAVTAIKLAAEAEASAGSADFLAVTTGLLALGAATTELADEVQGLAANASSSLKDLAATEVQALGAFEALVMELQRSTKDAQDVAHQASVKQQSALRRASDSEVQRWSKVAETLSPSLASLAASSSNFRKRSCTSAVQHCQDRTHREALAADATDKLREALQQQEASSLTSMTSMPAWWGSVLAASPLEAFHFRTEEEQAEHRIFEDPEPCQEELPMDLPDRPNDELLSIEFRAAAAAGNMPFWPQKASKAVHGSALLVNTKTGCCPVNKGPKTAVPAKPASGKRSSDKVLAVGSRGALRELQPTV